MQVPLDISLKHVLQTVIYFIKIQSQNMLHKCKSHLMLPNDASAIRYFFETCPSDSYLFHKNSVPKYLFQKTPPPPPC